MSDCLHCDINDLVQKHLEGNNPDLADLAARIVESLADLILLAPEADQAKLKTTLKDRKKLREDIAEAEARFKEATIQLPEEKEIPELLRQVSNLGRDSGLEITLFRQQTETLQDLHAEVPVEMAVRGGYHQIALFFEKVRRLDRIVNISDIGIKNPQMADGRLQVDASFFATTYRFLTEEEQDRIAKQKEEEAKKKGKSGSES